MNITTIRQLLLALCATSLTLAGSIARADLIIEFENAQMDAGQAGTIDVFVRSTDVDRVAQYSVQFVVEHVRGQGIMEFLPTNLQDDSEIFDSNYLFAEDSNDFVAKRDDDQRNRITHSDFTFTTVAVGDGMADRRLLARLDFNHIVPNDALATFAGAEYQVRVMRSIPLTFFAQEDFDTRIAIDEVSYDNFGTIRISPVPEPSASLLLAVFGFATMLRRPRSGSRMRS